MIDTANVYRCDRKGCDITVEVGEYAQRPLGWVVVQVDPKDTLRDRPWASGTREFCSAAHAASYLSLESARLARR